MTLEKLKSYFVVSGRMFKRFLKNHAFELLVFIMIANVLFKFTFCTVLILTLVVWAIFEVLTYLKVFGKELK